MPSADPVQEPADDNDDGDVVAVDDPVFEAAAEDGRTRHFPCHQCAADLEWKPGVGSLTCPYCGHVEEAPVDEQAIREFAFNDYLQDRGKQRGLGTTVRPVRCPGCAAEVDLSPEVAVQDCPFCGTMLEDSAAHTERIMPEAVVAFAVERDAARAAFRAWLKSRWFAPRRLATEATAEGFQGVYRSWWTFDSHTRSHWSGEAGTYYYVTRTRTVNGKTQTYRKRKVRWRHRSGVYEAFFDDELVPGFYDDYGIDPTGYRISQARAYDRQVLAGFVCERYAIQPDAAWQTARQQIESSLRSTCRRLLGGDTQRNLLVHTAHQGITFKSLLLPVWHSTYRYRGKIYRIAVNGQTGQVSAQRPWSWVKITLLAIAIAALIVVGAVLMHL